MSSRRCVTLLATMIAAVASARALPASATQLGPPPGAKLAVEKLLRIDDFINAEVAAGKIPGAIVLIQRHGKPVYFKIFGKRDVDAGIAMTEDAIFPIHSVTKTITSFSALMLVDRGKIALDDPVSKYIPSFADMKVGVERKDDDRESRCSTWCRRAARSPLRICCCTPRGSPTASTATGWSNQPMTASISAISTMPDSPSAYQKCRWPSSRARCGTMAIPSTCSAASSRSSPGSRSINSRSRTCSIPWG